jgi:hypothetical protein
MTRSWKVLVLAILVSSLALAAWLVFREGPTPQNQAEVLNRMIKLQREGRYDRAVQIVQNWMNDSRRNKTLDGFMYQQIAMV